MDSRGIWTQNENMMKKKTIFDPKYKKMIESLKSIRMKQGISQRDLANKLGMAHSYIGRAETCERRLDIMDLIAILRALNLTDSEIIKFLQKLL